MGGHLLSIARQAESHVRNSTTYEGARCFRAALAVSHDLAPLTFLKSAPSTCFIVPTAIPTVMAWKGDGKVDGKAS